MFELGSGKWSKFEQMTMADTEAGVEKEFLAKSTSEPRQSIKDAPAVCWIRRNPGSEEERERYPQGGYTPRSKTKR